MPFTCNVQCETLMNPREWLDQRGGNFNKCDTRFQEQLRQGEHFGLHLDQHSFMSLVWLEGNVNRTLTKDTDRTLFDAVRNLLAKEWTFELLADQHRRVEGQYEPEWFGGCVGACREILAGELRGLGVLGLTVLNSSECERSPTGSFYIYDGNHRSIAYAYLVETGKVKFESVPAILMTPRR